MNLSVIIVSWRVKDLLKQCLQSIFAYTSGISFEVIVVDNGSGDGTVEMIKDNFSSVKIIASKKNLGFAKACNLGIKNSTGDYFLLLNPDTKFLENSLQKCFEFMARQSSVGVLGCKLLNRDNSIQPSVRRFPGVFDHLLMMFKLHHLFAFKKYSANDFDYAKTAEVDQVMGAFFIVSKNAFKKVGLLDEQYYIWFEEVDYCQRVKKAGFKVFYFSETGVIHYGGQSFKQLYNFKKQWIYNKSRLRYIAKHQSVAIYALVLLLSPVSLLLSAVSIKYQRRGFLC